MGSLNHLSSHKLSLSLEAGEERTAHYDFADWTTIATGTVLVDGVPAGAGYRFCLSTGGCSGFPGQDGKFRLITGTGAGTGEIRNNIGVVLGTFTYGESTEDETDLGTIEPSADRDGDGVQDTADAFPDDPTETADTDGDGVGDNTDVFPNDPAESVDGDGDGVGDNSDAFPDDPAESVDTDGDGVGDNADAFPNDSTESADRDGDRVGDNGDAFPEDPAENADSDGDGIGDNGDAVPASSMAEFITIDGQISSVPNRLLPDGSTFNDLIQQAKDSSRNHGQFVSAVAHLANDWKSAGLITGQEHGEIVSLVSNSGKKSR